ncbi:MAG: restriction endonuclease subunit S [Spirochaetota bacterium]
MKPDHGQLPSGWRWGKVGDRKVATIVMGQSPPSVTYNKEGCGLPFYQGKADFGDVSPKPRVWCSAPKQTAESGDILLSVRAPVGPTNLASHRCCIGRGLVAISGTRSVLTLYLYFWFKHVEPWLSEQGEGSTFRAIGKARLENIVVPLPPLPVQERIVHILTKADEIRRKRKEALELSDKILPALFLEMFGDPSTNPKGWLTIQFEDCLLDITRECNKAQQHEYKNNTSGSCPIIDQGERLIGGYVDDTTLLYQGALPVIIFGDHTRRFKFVDFPFVLGADGTKVLRVIGGYEPEYIYWHLRLAQLPDRGYERHFKFVRELRFMSPHPTAQKYFAHVVQQYAEQRMLLSGAMEDAEATFQSLLSRAFTGELTAEWEAENAEWIAVQQALQERLSRLLLLALLVEKTRRSGRASAEVLVTALMKYTFLLQMEGSASRRRFFHFVPYHYGPFAKELYADLEALQQEGLVRVDHDTEEDKTRITVIDPAKAQEALAVLPEELQQDAAQIIETYGDLDHNALLEVVYEQYPAYARKSRLKQNKIKSTRG